MQIDILIPEWQLKQFGNRVQSNLIERNQTHKILPAERNRTFIDVRNESENTLRSPTNVYQFSSTSKQIIK